MSMFSPNIGFKTNVRKLARPRLQSHVNRLKRRGLFQFGGYVRSVARNLIKKKEGSSAPGQPPHRQVGTLRDHIYFHVTGDISVVAGAAALSQSWDGNVRVVDGLVPQVLEHGGEIVIAEQSWTGEHWWQVRKMGKNSALVQEVLLSGGSKQVPVPDPDVQGKYTALHLRARRVKIAPRPYMAVAYERTLARIDRFFSERNA